MKNRFFTKNQTELHFEWNAAKQSDWAMIRRNFVSAYICAYKDCSIDELNFDSKWKQYAEEKWNEAYQKARVQGAAVLVDEIIGPVQFYFNHEKQPLEKECVELSRHFSDVTYDISPIREKLIKLILLKNYFENEFEEEKHKIDLATKKIDYLVARFHERPIAFFACELNSKSGHVYLRFVTMEPAFHRLGLGEKILEQIAEHYPGATGMELYTRKANYSAQSFYKHCGFQELDQFDFGKPKPTLDAVSKAYFPDDDATDHPDAFIAFSKMTHYYRG